MIKKSPGPEDKVFKFWNQQHAAIKSKMTTHNFQRTIHNSQHKAHNKQFTTHNKQFHQRRRINEKTNWVLSQKQQALHYHGANTILPKCLPSIIIS